jgi:hypothetical protein
MNYGTIRDALTENIVRQVQLDDRYDRVESIVVDFLNNSGNAASGAVINLVVRLAGSDQNVPISFAVNFT